MLMDISKFMDNVLEATTDLSEDMKLVVRQWLPQDVSNVLLLLDSMKMQCCERRYAFRPLCIEVVNIEIPGIIIVYKAMVIPDQAFVEITVEFIEHTEEEELELTAPVELLKMLNLLSDNTGPKLREVT